jgi:carboxymethylenebutenolidase
MAALKQGNIYDVTVEPRTLVVDGLDVAAVHARPDGMPGAGIVLHPDIGGLRPLFEEMARTLATHGFAVCCFEPFSAVGGLHGAAIDERMGAVKNLDDDTQLGIFSAAADLLVVEDDVARVSALGFCMGGHYVFKAASSDRFDAAVAFYGMLHAPEGWGGPGHRIDPIEVAPQMVPTLAIFGSNDSFVPNTDVEALAAAWKDRNDCELIVVEGAEHGFVHDPERPAHRAEAAEQLWDRALTWML